MAYSGKDFMLKRLLAIAFIYVCTCIAWAILGSTVLVRTQSFDSSLRESVSQIWGTIQTQHQPSVSYQVPEEVVSRRVENGKTITDYKTHWNTVGLPLEGSDIGVKLGLDYRQKGLLWYSTYRVAFNGDYTLVNDTGADRDLTFAYDFPAAGAVYDNFRLSVGGREEKNLAINAGTVTTRFHLAPGERRVVKVGYETQGLDQWWYDFGEQVHQVKAFRLVMDTDFDKIDFPANAIGATEKQKTATGWQLTWKYTNLLTSVKIGMEMPKRLNPGPWVSQVTFTAPISLFLFLFLILVVTALRGIRLHPMHYFFLSAAFFSFHLLLAYLVDHMGVEAAVAIASVVSVALAVSYMRLVVNDRFAFVEVALAQLVYLVLFSCTFFLDGYTGLAITVLCVATLFVVMQITGRLDWEQVFAAPPPKGPPAAPPAREAA